MPVPLPPPRARLSDLSALRALATPPTHRHLVAALARSVSVAPSVIPPPMFGALRTSSVKESPVTQPYNNTSVILGVNMGGAKLLLTADAGAEALSNVGPEWNRLLYLGVPHHGSDGNLSKSYV